jgi:hypothetical protein
MILYRRIVKRFVAKILFIPHSVGEVGFFERCSDTGATFFLKYFDVG